MKYLTLVFIKEIYIYTFLVHLCILNIHLYCHVKIHYILVNIKQSFSCFSCLHVTSDNR